MTTKHPTPAELKSKTEELHDEIKALKAEIKRLKAAEHHIDKDEFEYLKKQQAEREWRLARGLP